MLLIKTNAIQFNKEFNKQYYELTNKGMKTEVKDAVEELRAITPVDTGLARDSWTYNERLQFLNKFSEYKITNEQDYVLNLNQGSSSQAPARFVETVLSRYGSLEGLILQKVEE
jgi:hypothetical protein